MSATSGLEHVYATISVIGSTIEPSNGRASGNLSSPRSILAPHVSAILLRYLERRGGMDDARLQPLDILDNENAFS